MTTFNFGVVTSLVTMGLTPEVKIPVAGQPAGSLPMGASTVPTRPDDRVNNNDVLNIFDVPASTTTTRINNAGVFVGATGLTPADLGNIECNLYGRQNYREQYEVLDDFQLISVQGWSVSNNSWTWFHWLWSLYDLEPNHEYKVTIKYVNYKGVVLIDYSCIFFITDDIVCTVKNTSVDTSGKSMPARLLVTVKQEQKPNEGYDHTIVYQYDDFAPGETKNYWMNSLGPNGGVKHGHTLVVAAEPAISFTRIILP
jgi:hypothetical protein